MMTVDGDTNRKEFIKLLDHSISYSSRLNVIYATPSLLCIKANLTFYIYDLILRKVVYERSESSLFAITYAISPDGRTRFTTNFARHVICATPLKMTDEIELLATKAKYTNKGYWTRHNDNKHNDTEEEQLYLRSYNTDVQALAMVYNHFPMFEGIKGMVENRLDVTTRKNRYDIIFPTMIRPIATFKSPTGQWARIMSNGTLETHLTWPAVGIKLTGGGGMKNITDTFANDPALLIAIAWFSFNRSIGPGQEEIPAREAVGLYVERLTTAIAVAVGII